MSRENNLKKQTEDIASFASLGAAVGFGVGLGGVLTGNQEVINSGSLVMVSLGTVLLAANNFGCEIEDKINRK